MHFLMQVEGIFFGPESATWQGVTDAFTESTQGFKLPDGSVFYTSSITVAASELGTFLDPKNREMIDVLVDLWDGREVPWKRRTRSEGQSEIPNPWFNFIGATTPGWLSENFPEYAVRGGFTSRTIFVTADSKRHYNAYPGRGVSPEDVRLKLALLSDLQEMAQLAGEFRMTEEAYAWGDVWYQTHWENRPPHSHDDRLSGYLARKQTHLHKIAMIISAAQSNSMVVTDQHLKTAEAILNAVESDSRDLFAGISDDPKVKHTQYILSTLRTYPNGLPRKELWRLLITKMSQWDFNNALDGCISAGLILQAEGQYDMILRMKKEKAKCST